MPNCFLTTTDKTAIPVYAMTVQNYRVWISAKDEHFQQWVESTNFNAKPGTICLVPGEAGRVQCVLLGIKSEDDFWSFGALPRGLPPGIYSLTHSEFKSKEHCYRASLAWGLGAYQYSRYQDAKPVAQLVLPKECQVSDISDLVDSICLGRDWVNTPADVMTPAYLAETVKQLAKECSAKFSVIVGDKLLKANYPTIHAVGRGSSCEPRLAELHWGEKNAPLITLVGKGVCFDSGGLDLKPAAGMRLMKKDMSGAAHTLTLARMIMKQKLRVRLRVLIPAVENAIDGNSYHPGDVVKTRAGIHVEIDNTDAEGRLVLCDALAAASEDSPELIIDFASLTGAARVALGPDIAAFYSSDESVAQQVVAASKTHFDPLWPMPLYQPYAKYLKSDIADCVNSSSTGYAGSITAALYLQKFVPETIPWVHFDATGWNSESRPGRPKGAEILAVRAMFEFLKERFGIYK